MKQKQQIIVLIVIIVIAALIWFLYVQNARGPADSQPLAPVAGEDDGRYVPELNNTLETSVTVIAPTNTPPPTGQ